jgi:hypothetical protein
MLRTTRKETHSLPLCVKIVLRKYLMDVHLFLRQSAKINERPKIFSEHDFDAKRQRVSFLSSRA